MPMVLAQVAMSPPALVAPAPPRPSIITNPDWFMKPTGDELMALYPKEAQANRVEGRAVIQCGVSARGLLMDCAVIREDPAGAGFGDAALRMSALFRMRPQTKDGVPVPSGVVNIPIRFSLPPPAPPAGLPPPPPGSLDSRTVQMMKKPGPVDYSRLFPLEGARRGIEGHVILQCVISDQHRLETCSVLEETPAATGFGAAALKLSKLFETSDKALDGTASTGRPIRIGIRFNLPHPG
jgi:TonB family protein